MLSQYSHWIIRFLVPSLVLTSIAFVLHSGAVSYPSFTIQVPPKECAKAWFDDTGPSRTVQLEAHVKAHSNERPALLFCLGARQLRLDQSNTGLALENIRSAATVGYLPAAEWLAMAYLKGIPLERDAERAYGALELAAYYHSDFAREMLYAFGMNGWRRDVVYSLGIAFNAFGFGLLCKRENGFDLRFLGPVLLFWAVGSVFILKNDQFLALGGNIETLMTFVVGALGANLTAAVFRHDPSMPRKNHDQLGT